MESPEKKNKECSFGDNNSDVFISIGDIEIDPCEYEEIEVVENCTVYISRCKKCGKIDIAWERNSE